MDDEARIQHHHGGPPGDAAPHRPAAVRLHHRPFFWIAAFFILVAMAIFVVSDGFLIRPAPAAVHGP